MLKKTILTLTLLLFAFGILFASVWRTSAQGLPRPELVTGDQLVNEQSTPAAEEKKEKVEYNLTWPGLLPDHFLYPIKMIRDRIWVWLTTDSLKKAELLLKLADKRIWSAKMLLEKEKEDLAVTTATKAEKYLERAIRQTKVAEEGGKETERLLERLSRATLKHEEVLMEMSDQVDEKIRPIVRESLNYAKRAHEEVKRIESRSPNQE